MNRNVEIKARLSPTRFESVRRLAKQLSTAEPQRLVQTDTFFKTPTGRLKLREFENQSAELIGYIRPDKTGPKTSQYNRAFCDGPATRAALDMTLGTIGVVKKMRDVYFVDQTRIHLDQVEGLGTFLELEVVLESNQTESEGQQIAQQIMDRLGIETTDLIEGAYFDLLTVRK